MGIAKHAGPEILVIRERALGDVILTTPVIEQIHANHSGHCCIDVHTGKPEVFSGNPYVRNTFAWTALSRDLDSYDHVIDLDMAYEMRPSMHITDAYAELAFGASDLLVAKQPKLYSSERDAIVCDWICSNLIGGEYAVIHMRYDTGTSRNLPQDYWRSVVTKLLNHTNLKLVQVGAATEHGFQYGDRLVDLRGKLNLHELHELIAKSRLYVGADSGTLHVAAATNVPIIAMFTSAHHDLRKPLGRNSNTLFYPLIPAVDCYGCQSRHTPPITRLICDRGDPNDPPCTRQFDVAEFELRLREVLDSTMH